MSYKLKRRLSLFILIVGLPLYVILIVNLISSFDRPNFLVELLIYLLSGIVWALPLRSVFRGVGQAEE
ncbi:MAG: DUF2842 domain-containing protein [Paracoccaceae bacterium]|jgi:hypothetical protein|nr:DUF2842 domain-containing protein [Rhodobacterales bacterium]NCW07284.1 DUF2842 domain-containing protein [Rhodobacterales bacterium]NCX53940.1 DUF2842 domain-containing protein [Rhodobacterales bacterium]NCX57571.1 DUF2842 domain-containing protein [Paracoccaceae bacterium]NCX87314.1 DUF2842 domain-containing protein [Paracoccaceae bacterium]